LIVTLEVIGADIGVYSDSSRSESRARIVDMIEEYQEQLSGSIEIEENGRQEATKL
jgi:hypothetical protein